MEKNIDDLCDDISDNNHPVYCGALRSPVDPNDCIFEHLARGPLGYFLSEVPVEFDLRKHSQPSRDQGNRGTCAAFTAAAIREIQENRNRGFSEWMSPEFIYYHRENKPSNGMYGRNVFQILQRFGSVPESVYSYRTVDADTLAPKKELYEIAAQYRIANFARVNTCDGLKRALLELGPCYLQLPLYSQRPYFWRSREGENCNGGHAVTVVGFNKDGFILKNSWGSDWNGDGCVIFPYSDWGIQWECWVSVDETSEDDRDSVPHPIKITIPEFENRRPSITQDPINLVPTPNPVVKNKKKDKNRCIIL